MLEPEQQLELVETIKAAKDGITACLLLQEAFGKPLLWRVQFKIADSAAAHDVVTDTWEQVAKNIHKFDPARASFYRFVCLYADREASRYFGQKKREEKLSSDYRILFSNEGLTPEQELILQQTAQEKLRKYDLLLASTLQVGGQAHHILVFGFSEIIFPLEQPVGRVPVAVPLSESQKPTPRLRQRVGANRTSGYPRRVVSELSDTLLEQLGQTFEEKYEQYSMLPRQVTHNSFQQLNRKLMRPAKNQQVAVGQTCLNNYYGKDPEHNVSDWAYKVKQKVKQFILNHRCSQWSADR